MLLSRHRMNLLSACIGLRIVRVSAAISQSGSPVNDQISALRRHGSWRRDLNAELTLPFTRNIANSWGKVFESDLFGPFEAAVKAVINKLLMEIEDTAAPGLKDRTKIQGEMCLVHAGEVLQGIMDLVQRTLTTEQKEVSRCMAPHVQSQLIDGYDLAMEERGIGSVARQKV
jgi:hypothetical protein